MITSQKTYSWIKRNSSKIEFYLGWTGVLLSTYLYFIQQNTLSNGCSVGGGCSYVLSGEYSKFLGQPIALWGILFYVGLMALVVLRKFYAEFITERYMNLYLLSGVLFTIYLRYLEIFKINHFCKWCWGSVVIIVLLAMVQYARLKQGVDLDKEEALN